MFCGNRLDMFLLVAAVLSIQISVVVLTTSTEEAVYDGMTGCKNVVINDTGNWQGTELQKQKVELAKNEMGECQKATMEVLANWDSLTWFTKQVEKIGAELLNIIIENDDADLLQELLDNGLDVNRITTVRRKVKSKAGLNMTLFCQAAMLNKISALKLLLDRGSDLDLGSDDNKTPLMYAAQQKYRNIAEYLIEHGANINAISRSGSTAVHFAVLGCLDTVIETLKHKGANINVKNSKGVTPLILAAANGNYKAIKVLLKYNAEINVSDFENRTSLHHAAKNNHTCIVKYLLEHGAHTNIRDTNNKTAEDYAQEKGFSLTSNFTSLLNTCDSAVHPCT